MVVYSCFFPSLYVLDRYWKLFLSDLGEKKIKRYLKFQQVRWGSWYQHMGQKFSYIIVGWNHAKKHQNNVSIGLLGIWFLTVSVIKIMLHAFNGSLNTAQEFKKVFFCPGGVIIASILSNGQQRKSCFSPNNGSVTQHHYLRWPTIGY